MQIFKWVVSTELDLKSLEQLARVSTEGHILYRYMYLYSAAQRHANIKTRSVSRSKLVQHAEVNAFHFKHALGTRIHYILPMHSSQVAIVSS